MLKDLLRIIGTACIITGISLYFIDSNDAVTPNADVEKALRLEIATLEKTLQKTEEELANLQLITSEQPEASDDEPATDAVNDKNDEQIEEPATGLTLEISEGTSSLDVAELLTEKKIVSDVDEFNDFLTNHGYAKKIQIGIYKIDQSMSPKDIAELITTLKE